MVVNYIRYYGDPGFNLSALLEMADLINDEVTPINVKAPVIGPAIFTTQAGIHQSGVQRQQKAEGGDIYLPYSPEILGGGTKELHRVGALSGSEGIVAILNQKALETTGKADVYSTTSRAVKYVYDKVQDAYDGAWDESQHKYGAAKKTFFSADELYVLALEFEAGRGAKGE